MRATFKIHHGGQSVSASVPLRAPNGQCSAEVTDPVLLSTRFSRVQRAAEARRFEEDVTRSEGPSGGVHARVRRLQAVDRE
jgi:hypothetical protein